MSPTAVYRATKRAERAGYAGGHFICRDIEAGPLPWREGPFDLCICSHILEHLKDGTSVPQEVERVLAPGGRLIVMVPINERFPSPLHMRGCSRDPFLEQVDEATSFRLVQEIFGGNVEVLFDWVAMVQRLVGFPRLKSKVTGALSIIISRAYPLHNLSLFGPPRNYGAVFVKHGERG